MTKGWYGAAEKAETFFFEHDWKPVPGHPPEVATCDVCGLNRWSDEHMSTDERRQHAERMRALRVRLDNPLDPQVAARLARRYGPKPGPGTGGRVDAIGPKPTSNDGVPDVPVLGPTPGGVTPKEAEDRAIAENAATPQAQAPHPFMEAEFPNDSGQPRCRLCGDEQPAHKVFEPEIPVAAADESGDRATLTERPAAPVLKEGERAPLPEPTKAFLTEVNGRTLLTAPANVFTTETEKALHANEHFLWMQGRFVGAEKANRNGAFWKTEDLELGELSVRHGPLNWLHEAKHVIGTIADTRMVVRDEQLAMGLDQPHISALSAIWKWIYPDEAWVIEQASDAGKLWYSMECVSKEVACVGEGGCGAKASYTDYLQGKGETCAHMTERSATRHFANPTFLGGAVIVPPVRPGWAEADASVLRQAASLAEHAYEQAQPADTSASEWEQLMAQVLRFGGA